MTYLEVTVHSHVQIYSYACKYKFHIIHSCYMYIRTLHQTLSLVDSSSLCTQALMIVGMYTIPV